MPSWRVGKGQSNRSQQSLDSGLPPAAAATGGTLESQGAGGAQPPAPPTAAAASAGPAPAPGQQQQQQQQLSPSAPPQPQPGPAQAFASGDLHSSHIDSVANRTPVTAHTASFVVDPRQQQPKDFEQVARSQSHRFPQQQAHSPAAYQAASGSLEDLSSSAFAQARSPLLAQGPTSPQQQHLPQQQQAQQQPQPEARRSTRKLIKNIFQPQHHHQQPSIDNGAQQVARRPSRVSQPQSPSPTQTQTQIPPASVSQLSVDQPDWQQQSSAPPPAPGLQAVGDPRPLQRRPSELSDSNRDLLHHHHRQQPQNANSHEPPHPAIRHVQTDTVVSPYGLPRTENPAGAYHQPHAQVLVPAQQPSPDTQQHPYGQAHFDPSQQQFQFHHLQQGQYQQQPGAPSIFTGGLLEPSNQHRNPETISQLSHDSPIADTEPIPINLHSAQSSPAVNYPPRSHELLQSASQPQPQGHIQGQSQAQSVQASAESRQEHQDQFGQQQQHQQQYQQHQQQVNREDDSMVPQAQGGPPAPNRRSTETEKNMRGQMDPPPGPPPGYRHNQTPSGNPLQPPGSSGLNQNYRPSGGQDRQFDGATPEGRNSPQPTSTSAETPAENDKAFKELLTKYKNVKRLYFDGKNQIELLNGQVEQLQNAVANQRISQSRTSLDDNEYATRFNRLNGAINNLSFNIRKDWVAVPSFLDGYVSPDALRTGKQEMTAAGRAAITSWVLDFVFDRCFHPGLDPSLSYSLKQIEQNIRSFSYTLNSHEEYEALTSKVVSWRMATLEGLQPVLASAQSADHRVTFTTEAARNLTNKLFDHLTNPPPTGVDGSVSMIVELAVGIASNMPLESRDVAITFPSPGSPMQPNIMEVEKTTGLPPLETRPTEAERDADTEEEERAGKDGGGREAKGASKSSSRAEKAGKSASSSTSNLPPKDANRIRFAGFLAVEVRGRQVLVRAPVWTMA
ncbi:hypothetical protein GGTG_01368 [Gaeumannomyces tritici R3-111a-1]|uniref:S-adenosylmethionine-dependent methyltransferase-like protein n=1 Tax=Gaeumannomyces tritici (strain R3-111a-1) TaxID=644352 RepID=J3NJD6_GAET3|nr:hypothetical protein GGTG_01368 [Gaeumannomyces tritici R3-111a-1]EJT81387.1 hypothetical protein GGTG_01368 [Gaeumannomyces tritici R3-111a-1]